MSDEQVKFSNEVQNQEKMNTWLSYGYLPTPLVFKAWKDEKFRERLINDPKQCIKELGYSVPDEVSIQLHTNQKNKYHLFLPEMPEHLK